MSLSLKPLVINFFGGPGSGKSATAAGTFYYLKRMGINTELVTEYAKELVWEQHQSLFEDQVAIFAGQQRRMNRLVGKVDVIVTDSPLILGSLYAPKHTYKTLYDLMFEVYDSYNNVNIVLERCYDYQELGRNQNEQQALKIDEQLQNMLRERKCHFIKATDYHDACVHIIDTIIKPILNNNREELIK